MPMDRTKYPDDWPAFSLRIRKERAADRCECEGECGLDHDGRCRAINGQRKFVFAVRQGIKSMDFASFLEPRFSTIWLTVAHLWKHGCDCEKRCANEFHVKALCQACHLRYDQPQHKRTREQNKDARRPLIAKGERE